MAMEAEGKKITSSRKTKNPIASMDPELWGNLTEELVEHIQACLPIPSLFRLGSVCRQWNFNLSNRRFLTDYTHLQSHDRPHYVMLVEQKGHKYGLSYSDVFNRWYTMPFTYLAALPTGFDMIASAGGLLCLKDRETNALSVFNPMNSSCRRLPHLVRIRNGFETGMLMEKNGIDYRIIAWRDDIPTPVTEVYSSRTNKWELKNSIDVQGDALPECGVVCGSVLYILVIFEYMTVFAYEIYEDRWAQLKAPLPPNILYGFLVDNMGSLVMVAALGHDFPVKGISIWKLHKDCMLWVHVLDMPHSLFKKFTKNFKKYDAFKCAGSGNEICFIADSLNRALMCDFKKKKWWWSPDFLGGDYLQITALKLNLIAEA
eukprot:Gb_06038 [translate_table: standard]